MAVINGQDLCMYLFMVAVTAVTGGIIPQKVYKFPILSNATLECKYPTGTKVTWFNQTGKPINYSTSKYSEVISPESSTLVIRNLQESDFGTYSCRTGSIQSSTKLIILGKVLNLQANHFLKAGKPGQIPFLVRGNPFPIIQVWKDEGDSLVVVAEWDPSSSDTKKGRMKVLPLNGINISSVELSDQGTYEIHLMSGGTERKEQFSINVSTEFPSKPVGVHIKVDGNTILAEWSKPMQSGGSKVLTYKIKVCIKGKSSCNVLHTGNALSGKITGLEFDTTYKVYITASNPRGDGEPYSVEVSIGSKIPLDIVLPLAIVGLILIVGAPLLWWYCRGRKAKRRRVPTGEHPA